MASPPPTVQMEQEYNCPICLGCLKDPMVLDCGHSFCHDCITNYCETWETLGDLECPVCKSQFQKGDFRRNWQLASIVEKTKRMRLSTSKEDLCSRHEEKLQLFCKEDEEMVCSICEHSLEHRGHTIILLQEAAEQYKVGTHRDLWGWNPSIL